MPDFTPEALRALRAAQIEAQREGRRRVSPAHLLLGALDPSAAPPAAATAAPAETSPETAAARVLLFLDTEPELLRLAVQTRLRAIAPPSRGAAEPKPTRAAVRSLDYAASEAHSLKSRHVGTEHILLGVARTRTESMPHGQGIIWNLRNLRLVPESFWQAIRKRGRATHLVVPELLDEFGLDLPSLRIAAAAQSPLHDAPHWTREVQRSIDRAHREAKATGAGRVGAEHLWLGLLAEPATAATNLLHECRVSTACLETHLRATLRADHETAGPKIRYTAEARRAFTGAERVAREAHCRYIGGDHLLIALAGAAPEARPSARERAEQLLATEAPSRAEPAIAIALEKLDLPADHLRLALARPGQLAHLKAQLRTVNEVTARVHALVARELHLAPDKVHTDVRLPRANAPLFAACVREFDITLTPSDTKRIRTVGELTNVVCSKRRPEQLRADREVRRSNFQFFAFVAPSALWVMLFMVIFFCGGDIERMEVDEPLPVLVLVPLAVAALVRPRSDKADQAYRDFAARFLWGWVGFMVLLYFASPYITYLKFLLAMDFMN